MICNETGKECIQNCISNNGGYAGDDCEIIHQKYIKQSRRFPIILLIIIGVLVLLLVIFKGA